MRTIQHRAALIILLLNVFWINSCSSPPSTSDLGGLYNELAQHEDPYRNPIILIPGILGSKLVDRQTDQMAWGTFGIGGSNPNQPSGARLIALPMQKGKPLGELQDGVEPAGTLDQVVINFGGYPVILNTYAYIDSPQKRREIAIDHLKKSLLRAKQFVNALDLPAELPSSIRYYLVAGDSENTEKTAQFKRNGNLTMVDSAPGDSVVLRSSALLDERPRDNPHSRLVSPIKWNQVFFLFSDHRNITRYPEFTDNLLYILLESP